MNHEFDTEFGDLYTAEKRLNREDVAEQRKREHRELIYAFIAIIIGYVLLCGYLLVFNPQ